MKLFISHSWRDKAVAQRLADSLQGNVDVWLDLTHLKPGSDIQATIDAAIAQMDVVVLLWSKDAAASENVKAEIVAARRSGADLLPCLLDDTPPDELLKGLLAIDCVDRKIGLSRVMAAVLTKFVKPFGFDDTKALNDLKSADGVLNYVNDYYNKHGMSGEESAYWVLKTLESTNKSQESLSELRDKVGDALQFIKTTMARVEEAGEDRARLQAILDELNASPHKGIRGFDVLLSFVEGRLKTASMETKWRPAEPEPAEAEAPREEKPAGGGDAGDGSAASILDKAASVMAEKIAAASRASLEGLRARLAPFFPPQTVEASLAALNYYVASAPVSLREFAAAAEDGDSEALGEVAAELFRYLLSPDDAIPDEANGLLGFTDDAWLIHNSIYRCIEAGLLDASQFSVQWEVIVAADPIVLNIFPPQVRAALDRLITQYMGLLAEESRQYRPAFSPASWGGYQTYDASMGEGAAVGGGGSSYIQNAQSIDDIFYTVGGKGYLITG